VNARDTSSDDAPGLALPRHETVPCPECGHAATVVGRFSHTGVDYLQIRCTGSLTMLVTAHQVGQPRLRSA
jgi:hypothetical protein